MVLLRRLSKSNGCINPEITPTARYQQGKLHYVVTDHQGTPREIFSEGGQASWAGRLNTWVKCSFGVTATVKRRMTLIIPNVLFALRGNMKMKKVAL
nr:RHS domain-containing protein [Proteus mirabilis]